MPTANVSPAPLLLCDYQRFPDHTYQITWPAPESPEIAARVRKLLYDAGLTSDANDRRGYDHGVFVPLKVALPEPNFPVVQLSMRRGLDPAAHLAIGRALKPLREHGVLIIGSGQTYHNMRGFGERAPTSRPRLSMPGCDMPSPSRKRGGCRVRRDGNC